MTVLTKGNTGVLKALNNMVGITGSRCITDRAGQLFDVSQVIPLFTIQFVIHNLLGIGLPRVVREPTCSIYLIEQIDQVRWTG
jgi:hypothetical protein